MTEAVEVSLRGFGKNLSDSVKELAEEAHPLLASLATGSCAGGEWTSWFHWGEEKGFNECKKIMDVVNEREGIYDLVVVVGIGGSYAGVKAVDEIFAHSYASYLVGAAQESLKTKPIVYAGHNLSEVQLLELTQMLEAYSPIVNVISKSGTTTETSVAYRVLRDYLGKKYGAEELQKRFIATTDSSKGALLQTAKEENFTTFSIPDSIGGRYSVFTSVGLLPLALAGYNIEEFLGGSTQFYRDLATPAMGVSSSLINYAAARRAAWDAGKKVDVLAYGNPKLAGFVSWWQQLFGESDGKDNKGLLPVGMAYSTDLHSLGQYLQDGSPHLMETFLYWGREIGLDQGSGSRDLRLKVPFSANTSDGVTYLEGRRLSEINYAAMLAAELAHSDRGLPCLSIRVGGADLHHLGYLMSFFMAACAVGGLLLGVNPFDQPGVEAYKRNLFGIMGRPGFEELGTGLRARISDYGEDFLAGYR